MIKLTNYIVIIFSFFLGFGKFDPFNTNRIYFTVLTAFLVVSILTLTNVIKYIHLYLKEIVLLLLIIIFFSLADVAYTYSYRNNYIINFKYLSAIIIFWVLSYVFLLNYKLMILSILWFSISCSLIAIFYNIGYLESYGEILNGRLRIFGENPNSISTRMAISFIIIIYIIIENPLKFTKWRLLLLLGLPSLLQFVIDTGSRGSFLALVLGLIMTVVLSKRSMLKSILLISFGVIFVFLAVRLIADTVLLMRFEGENVLGGRDYIWRNSFMIFLDHPFGIGENGFIEEMERRYSDYHDTHNLFLYLLVSGGGFALISFLFFLRHLFLKSISSLKDGNSLFLILFGFLFFLISKTGGVLTYLVMWYFFAVINSSFISNNKLAVDE